MCARPRFPYHTTFRSPKLVRYVRLFKRRRRCRDCGHRHGPNKNNDARVCTAMHSCGCDSMTDWLPVPPAEHFCGGLCREWPCREWKKGQKE